MFAFYFRDCCREIGDGFGIVVPEVEGSGWADRKEVEVEAEDGWEWEWEWEMGFRMEGMAWVGERGSCM